MSSNESRIVSVTDGEDLLVGIRREAEGIQGWVQAVGHVEQAEIKLAGQGADRRRSVAARTTLASLSGPVAGPYGVTLVREAHAGSELYAGILLGARSLGVTLFIAPALVAAGTHVGPAQAAQEEEFEQAEPEVGDLLHHFAFGLCEVVGASGDRLKLRDPGEGGRVREISTERLKITGPTLEGDKRLFTLIRKG